MIDNSHNKSNGLIEQYSVVKSKEDEQKLNDILNSKIIRLDSPEAPEEVQEKVVELTQFLNTDSKILLEPIQHIYNLMDQIEQELYAAHLRSVTTDIGYIWGTTEKLEAVDKITMYDAQDFGTAVHEIMERFYDNGMVFDVTWEEFSRFNALGNRMIYILESAIGSHNELIQKLESENIVGEPVFKMETAFYDNKTLWVGTCDGIVTYAVDNGDHYDFKRGIFDFKTTQVRKSQYHEAQLNMYHYLMNNLAMEMGAETVKDENIWKAVVYFSKKLRLNNYLIHVAGGSFDKDDLKEVMYSRLVRLKYQLMSEQEQKDRYNPEARTLREDESPNLEKYTTQVENPVIRKECTRLFQALFLNKDMTTGESIDTNSIVETQYDVQEIREIMTAILIHHKYKRTKLSINFDHVNVAEVVKSKFDRVQRVQTGEIIKIRKKVSPSKFELLETHIHDLVEKLFEGKNMLNPKIVEPIQKEETHIQTKKPNKKRQVR